MACRLAAASTVTVVAGFWAYAQIFVSGVMRERKAQIRLRRLAQLGKDTPSTGLSLVLCGYGDISVRHRIRRVFPLRSFSALAALPRTVRSTRRPRFIRTGERRALANG